MVDLRGRRDSATEHSTKNHSVATGAGVLLLRDAVEALHVPRERIHEPQSELFLERVVSIAPSCSSIHSNTSRAEADNAGELQTLYTNEPQVYGKLISQHQKES